MRFHRTFKEKMIKKGRETMEAVNQLELNDLHSSHYQIVVQHVNKSFQKENGDVKVLDNINLQIKKGEFISLLGPSGCGKSTFLKMIGGLLDSTSGQLMIDGQKMVGPKKNIGFMFQKAVLLPWRTVEENLIL